MNVQERGFNVVVLLFAMVVFSSFVSSITSAMTRLRNLKATEVTQHFLLRKFLRENHISRDLSTRVTRYIDLVVGIHKRKTDRSRVELLRMLSQPLHLELQREIFEPILLLNPYFLTYSHTSPSAMSQLCFLGVNKYSISKGDNLFHIGAECKSMFILTVGSLFYRREKGIKGVRRLSVLRAGNSFCEAVLWMPWVHRGTMRALIESDLVLLDSRQFREVTLAHPDVAWHAKEQAKSFLEDVQHECCIYGQVWDIPSRLIYPDPSRIEAVYAEDIMEIRRAELEDAKLMDSDSSDEEVLERRLTDFATESVSQERSRSRSFGIVARISAAEQQEKPTFCPSLASLRPWLSTSK